MALTLDTVNQEVQKLFRTTASSELDAKTKATVAAVAARQQSIFERAGQTKGGVKSLTQTKDVSYDAFGDPVDATDSICEITDDVPGLSAELVGDPSEYQDDLNAIIGSSNTSTTITNGSLKKIISAGSPLAVAAALGEATGKSADEIQAALQDISTPDALDAISSLEQTKNEGIAVSSQLANVLQETANNFENVVRTIVGDLFGDLTITIDQSLARVINNLIDFNNPQISSQLSLNEVYRFISDEDYGGLTTKVSTVTNLDPQTVDATLTPLSLNPSKAITRSVSADIGSKSIPCYDIGSNENSWKGAETPTTGTPITTRSVQSSTTPTTNNSQFSFVSSREELAAEFASATRLITEVVTHWTGTYNNQDIGAEDVHEWHKQRGWSGIGYHYIIRRDGRIQRGRPINKTGAHAGANGHNKYSIGIAFAAGYNCPSGTKNPNKFISADSITPAQMKSFDMFLGAFYDEWPGGQVFGHVDTDNKGKVDPGFDVQEFARAKYGKSNVITDGQSPPLSPKQLALATPGTARA